LGLSIPIFNTTRTRNRVALAKIQLSSAQLSEETTKLQLKQAVDLAWFNKIAADERLQVLNQQVAAFKASFHSAEIRFNAGAGTVVDYTIAKNNLDRAAINLINARYDSLLRAKILDYYQGRLSI
jgi:outer membrane protein